MKHFVNLYSLPPFLFFCWPFHIGVSWNRPTCPGWRRSSKKFCCNVNSKKQNLKCCQLRWVFRKRTGTCLNTRRVFFRISSRELTRSLWYKMNLGFSQTNERFVPFTVTSSATPHIVNIYCSGHSVICLALERWQNQLSSEQQNVAIFHCCIEARISIQN